MRQRGKAWVMLILVGILACNMPRPTQVTIGTPAVLATPVRSWTASPAVSLLPTFSLSATPSPTPTVAATPSLLLADATRCREGPGQTFPIVTVVSAGAQLPLLGQWGGEYWLVRLENGKVCWLWGGAATPQGNLTLLPSVTPPPTSTLAAPTTPQNLRYTYSCEYVSGSIQVTLSLTWNETPRAEGYRIYRDGKLIAEVTVPYFTDITQVTSLNSVLTYALEAFNAGGASPQKSISFSCQ